MSEPPRAKASTFEDRTLEELARSSDRVVIGRVVETITMPSGPAGQPGIHTRATIAVSETLRGSSQSRVYVWVQGGELGNRLRWVAGQAQFVRTQEVLLFLFESEGAFWPNGMGRGKWTRTAAGWVPSVPLAENPSERIPPLSASALLRAVRGAR